MQPQATVVQVVLAHIARQLVDTDQIQSMHTLVVTAELDLAAVSI
jgi:hypothetical protein